jgi:hypothetical protein
MKSDRGWLVEKAYASDLGSLAYACKIEESALAMMYRHYSGQVRYVYSTLSADECNGRLQSSSVTQTEKE